MFDGVDVAWYSGELYVSKGKREQALLYLGKQREIAPKDTICIRMTGESLRLRHTLFLRSFVEPKSRPDISRG